jgi:hypothetical protein
MSRGLFLLKLERQANELQVGFATGIMAFGVWDG